VARFTISGRASAAATSTLPALSVYGGATARLRIVEFGIWNTTGTAFVVSLARLTTTGTRGTTITAFDSDDLPENAAIGTAYQAHTVGPTITNEKKRATIAAAAGAGVIWTWPDGNPLAIPGTANAGMGVLCPTGTGQVFDYTVSWIE
jgi:hypothetical protein